MRFVGEAEEEKESDEGVLLGERVVWAMPFGWCASGRVLVWAVEVLIICAEVRIGSVFSLSCWNERNRVQPRHRVRWVKEKSERKKSHRGCR